MPDQVVSGDKPRSSTSALPPPKNIQISVNKYLDYLIVMNLNYRIFRMFRRLFNYDQKQYRELNSFLPYFPKINYFNVATLPYLEALGVGLGCDLGIGDGFSFQYSMDG